jgi:hypothetical protein
LYWLTYPARRFSNLAQLRRKPLTVLPTTTLVDDNDNNNDLEAAAHDNYGSNKSAIDYDLEPSFTMGSFESCKREAAALERLLEDKVSRYQQVGQQHNCTPGVCISLECEAISTWGNIFLFKRSQQASACV